MYCDTLVEPLTRRIETEKKSLDEIAGEMCGNTVKNPRNKIIRIIKLLLGNKYLIKHAQTLGYHTDKAVRQKSTTDEVVNRKIVTEEIEDSDDSGQIIVTPIASCQTTVQPVNMEHEGEAGQSKGEQVLEVHDKPAACCQKRVVRKVRTESENITEMESGKMTEPEQVLDEQDDAPVLNVSDELVGEIKRLIEKFSLEEVRKALEVAENDI